MSSLKRTTLSRFSFLGSLIVGESFARHQYFLLPEFIEEVKGLKLTNMTVYALGFVVSTHTLSKNVRKKLKQIEIGIKHVV